MCKCQNCLAHDIHNFIYMADNLQVETPADRAKARLMSVYRLFLGFLQYVGLFFTGIVVGGGIVLKNPPVDKSALKQIDTLIAENQNLKDKFASSESGFVASKTPIVKETVILP